MRVYIGDYSISTDDSEAVKQEFLKMKRNPGLFRKVKRNLMCTLGERVYRFADFDEGVLEQAQRDNSLRAPISIRQMNVAICHEYYLTRMQEAALEKQQQGTSGNGNKKLDIDASYHMYKTRCGDVDYADGEN